MAINDDHQPQAQSRGRIAVLTAVAVSLFLLLTLPRLLSHGMFVDGVVYAAIARNLAIGRGSLWQPHFTDTQYPVFVEHPPGGLWLESLAFRLFGDSVFVEAFFGLVMGLILLWLLVRVWRAICFEESVGSWMPLALLSITPVVSFAFSNNLLECQETVCTTAAVGLGICAVRCRSTWHALLLGAGLGFLVGAACLVKGPTGLFPVIVPLLAALVLLPGSVRPAVVASAGVALALGVLALALYVSPEAHASIAAYLHQQVWRSLSGERTTGQSRLATLSLLSGELVIPAAVLVPLWIWARREAPPVLDRKTLFLLAVALSASLPIMLSSRHANRYLVPSLPFFAMALSALFSKAGARLEGLLIRSERSRRMLVAVAALLVIVAVTAMLAERGKVRKAVGFHNDFTLQPLLIPEGEVIGVCPDGLLTFQLRAEFARSFNASLAYDLDHRFLLVSSESSCSLPERCRPFHPPQPIHYRLYDCGTTESPAP